MTLGDTIVAPATPFGHSGVAVIRITGPQSFSIIHHLSKKHRFINRHATVCSIIDSVWVSPNGYDTNSGNTAGVLRVSNVGANASFTNSETLTGDSSGLTATLGSQAAGSLTNYDGELLYIENRSAVSRASDQIEDIKLVVKF